MSVDTEMEALQEKYHPKVKKRRKTMQSHLECPICHTIGQMRKKHTNTKTPSFRIDTLICLKCGYASRWSFELIEEDIKITASQSTIKPKKQCKEDKQNLLYGILPQ